MKQKNAFIQNKVEIVEDRNDIVWAMDENYKLTDFNTSFSALLKRNGSITVERGIDLRKVFKTSSFFDPCEQGCERALNRYATTSKHTFEENGEIVVHEFSFQPFMNSSGDIVGCCVWQKNITQEVNNNHRLLDSERKYREAQQVADVGHWNWDMIKNEITWSDQLYRIFGQEPDTFKADYESVKAIIHPEDRQVFDEDVNRSIKENVPHDIIHRIVVLDGEVRYVHQKGKAYYNEEGKPYRMSGTAQDVTKEVLSNHQILEQNHELQNFVRIISHNLRGPISNLLMLSKIYEWGKDEMNDDIVRKIEHTTEALDQTIKDLHLSLSLKSADKEKFREVSLRAVMKDVDGLLSEEIIKSKATVKTDFSGGETVFGAKSYVVNIFYNLILNAINYAKDEVPANIKIVSEETENNVVLKFVDNGIGMELTPEKERKIFDMYGRLSGATIGKGFGLYLVKTQVEAMEGKIEVESTKGEGSTFIVTLLKSL
ncbi:sensor histidine kinase [Flagellimonas marinaquae]|uniref:sensor histidine kinase n=1 Tax=Flagellimonas marinaquae TaxID=254955 RepID=UPI00207568D7|nr:PAS domain-containing protein [Allomuricauda aquimarina]USD23888.1 PAS domain-containing sensor histidine kinase [Allomuricauda aquimarina]